MLTFWSQGFTSDYINISGIIIRALIEFSDKGMWGRDKWTIIYNYFSARLCCLATLHFQCCNILSLLDLIGLVVCYCHIFAILGIKFYKYFERILWTFLTYFRDINLRLGVLSLHMHCILHLPNIRTRKSLCERLLWWYL